MAMIPAGSAKIFLRHSIKTTVHKSRMHVMLNRATQTGDHITNVRGMWFSARLVLIGLESTTVKAQGRLIRLSIPGARAVN